MTKSNAYFGVENLVSTYVLFFAKYYIYCCKCNNTQPVFTVYKSKLSQRLKVERYLALQSDKYEYFNEM